MSTKSVLFDEFIDFLHSLNHPTFTENGKQFQWSLYKMRHFCSYLGDPQNRIKCIHVAGTNGKGSCVSIMASYLRLSGYRVGIYISPEVMDVRERIQVNGKMISKHFMADFYQKLIEYSDVFFSSNPNIAFDTYSQVFVALAFSYFNKKNVDFAVIETGIGGLNDPTNIIMPVLSIITSIGYDHTELLGNDLRSIAKEKSGIIKYAIPVVVGHIPQQVESVFSQYAKNNNSCLYFMDKQRASSFPTQLITDSPSYEINNVECCKLALNVLEKNKVISTFDDELFVEAVFRHKEMNNLKGRWQKLYNKPDIYADICDNELAAENVFQHVKQLSKSNNYKRLVIIIGLTGPSKTGVLKHLPRNATYFFTQSHGYISAQEVKAATGFEGDCFLSPSKALERYMTNKDPLDLVIIIGSIHIISEAINFFDNW